MCWIGDNSVLRKADEDIHVFKIVELYGKQIRPYYYTNCLVYAKKTIFGKWKVCNNGLFHSSIKMDDTYNTCKIALHSYSADDCKLKADGCCIHVYCSNFVQSYRNMDKLYYMDCIIPAGSEYAVNVKGEYVSDTIKVKGIVPIIEKIYINYVLAK